MIRKLRFSNRARGFSFSFFLIHGEGPHDFDCATLTELSITEQVHTSLKEKKKKKKTGVTAAVYRLFLGFSTFSNLLCFPRQLMVAAAWSYSTTMATLFAVFRGAHLGGALIGARAFGARHQNHLSCARAQPLCGGRSAGPTTSASAIERKARALQGKKKKKKKSTRWAERSRCRPLIPVWTAGLAFCDGPEERLASSFGNDYSCGHRL